MAPQSLLDANVLAGGVADDVVAVKYAQIVGALAAHFLQHFAGAVGGAAVDDDDFGGMPGGMAQHTVNAAADILGVAVGVQDESEIAAGRFLQARGHFAGGRYRSPLFQPPLQRGLGAGAGAAGGILHHIAVGRQAGPQGVGGGPSLAMAQGFTLLQRRRDFRADAIGRRRLVQVQAKHPVKLQQQLQLGAAGQGGTGHFPSDGQGAGQVEIGVYRLPETAAVLLRFSRHRRRAVAVGVRLQAPLPDAAAEVGQRLFGGPQRGEGEVHPVAVQHGHTEVAEG